MESNEKLKIGKNKENGTCCFDDIIKFEDFDLHNIVIDEKSFENVLVYNIWYKTLIDAKSWAWWKSGT